MRSLVRRADVDKLIHLRYGPVIVFQIESNISFVPKISLSWSSIKCHRMEALLRIFVFAPQYNPVQPSPCWYHYESCNIICQYPLTKRGSRWFCSHRWWCNWGDSASRLYDSMSRIPFPRRYTVVSILRSCLLHWLSGPLVCHYSHRTTTIYISSPEN